MQLLKTNQIYLKSISILENLCFWRISVVEPYVGAVELSWPASLSGHVNSQLGILTCYCLGMASKAQLLKKSACELQGSTYRTEEAVCSWAGVHPGQ